MGVLAVLSSGTHLRLVSLKTMNLVISESLSHWAYAFSSIRPLVYDNYAMNASSAILVPTPCLLLMSASLSRLSSVLLIF